MKWSYCREHSISFSSAPLRRWAREHAYSLAARLEQVSKDRLTLNQGTLYPALVRLEQRGWIKGTWGKSDSNRDAKFYEITKAGIGALTKETKRWRRLAGFVDALLTNEP